MRPLENVDRPVLLAAPVPAGTGCLAAGCTECSRPDGVGEHVGQRVGQRVGIARRYEQAVDVVADHERDAADGRADDGTAAGHRLHQRHPERLGLRQGGQHSHPGPLVEACKLGMAHLAVPVDSVGDTESLGKLLESGDVVTVADDVEAHTGHGLAQSHQRLGQHVEALPSRGALDPTDVEDPRLAAFRGGRWGEQLAVDSRRDKVRPAGRVRLRDR